MYQLGLQVKKKKAKGGEFISPMLNISKGHTLIYVQLYINTVLQRITLMYCLCNIIYIKSVLFIIEVMVLQLKEYK